jgi:hypothetical protein
LRLDLYPLNIMRYFSIILFLFLSVLHSTVHGKDAENPAGKCAPIPVFSEDPGSTVPLQNVITDSLPGITAPAIVQDTVLPPCDIIFFKSGKLEYCKIIEDGPTTVSYKMCDYTEGATIVVNKSTVHKIRYANGREEIITSEQQQTQPKTNAYVKARKDPLAKLSLIFALCSAGIVILFGLVFLPMVLASLILGIISLAKISKRKGEFRGKGAAITGIVLSLLILLLIAL